MAERHQLRIHEFEEWFSNKKLEVPGVFDVFKRILKLEESHKAVTVDLQRKLLSFNYVSSFEKVCFVSALYIFHLLILAACLV